MQLVKSDYLHQPRNNAIDDQKLVLTLCGTGKEEAGGVVDLFTRPGGATVGVTA